MKKGMKLQDHILAGNKIQNMYNDSIELTVLFANKYSNSSEVKKMMNDIHLKLRKMKDIMDNQVFLEHADNPEVKNERDLAIVYYPNNRTPEETMNTIKGE